MTETREKREQWLREINASIPTCAGWEEWLKRTGELPPDFDAMEPCAELPATIDESVKNAGDWRKRREVIKGLVEKWLLGKAPEAPGEIRAELLEEREEEGARVRMLRLSFGPGWKCQLRVEVMIPRGDGPFPVFMTQWYHRSWALIAVRRG